MLKVFTHEMKMYVRDKKMLTNTLLLPILIYPLIIIVIGLGAFLAISKESDGIKVSIEGNNGEIIQALESCEGINIVKDKKYTDEDILNRKIDAIVKISPDKNTPIILKYDATQKSFSIGKITETIEKVKKTNIETILKEKGLSYESIEPINIKEINEKGEEASPFSSIINSILPMLFLIFPLISTSYLTTDLAAGEKERNTLEPLISTKISRSSILIGKLMFTSLISVMITIVAIIVLVLTIVAGISLAGVDMVPIGNISLTGMIIGIILLTLTVVFLSALQLAVSFFAKNYKESQLLLSPVMILVMVPIFIGMFIPESPILLHLPIFNVILLLKQFTAGIINVANIAIVMGWVVLYICLSLILCVKAINSEKFIFRV